MEVSSGGRDGADLGDGKIAPAICLNGSFSVSFDGVKGCNSLTGCVWLFGFSSGRKGEGATEAEGITRGAAISGAFIDLFCFIGGGDGSRTEEIATAATCRSRCSSISRSGISFGGCIFRFAGVSCGAGPSIQIRPTITANADKFKMVLGCGLFIPLEPASFQRNKLYLLDEIR